jgi:inorganic pyrophosphatase
MKIKIEIPRGSKIKKELHKKSKDKELHLECPEYYGYIPNTTAEDGDPIDAILLTKKQYKAGDLAEGSLLGILNFIDKGKQDNKFIFSDYLEKLTPIRLKEIKKFLSDYKKSIGEDFKIQDYRAVK